MAQRKIDISLTITEAQHLAKAVADAGRFGPNPALDRVSGKLAKGIALFESHSLKEVADNGDS